MNYSISYIHFIQSPSHVDPSVYILFLQTITSLPGKLQGSISALYTQTVIAYKRNPLGFGILLVKPPVSENAS